ncbi:MAG: GGDEF domain-containing response regulator [Gallionellaceae bacterium]|nr:MAG: GGDEF domain-containing response regulator [Gallionellaceae bacterium]
MMNTRLKDIQHLTLVHSSCASEPASEPLSKGMATIVEGRDSGYGEAESINILLVEDNPADRRLVAERLGSQHKGLFQLFFAERVSEALQILTEYKISVILLDLQLPDCRDLESITKIHAATTGVPIVVLSEVEDESLALKALKLGAQDFLVKWHTNEHVLVRAVQYALERKQAEERLYHLAHHDTLTGLPNRKYFYDQLKQAMAMARRNGHLLAVMFLDLGEFKKINDGLGHHVGDMLLQMVGKRLSACVRETDCLARMGGDEFIVAFTVNHPEDAHITANKILETFTPVFVIEGHSLHVRVSIGISVYPADGEDMESLIRNADMAMYRAKADSNHASRFWFYSSGFNIKTAEMAELEAAQSRALDNGEFHVYYQPQVDIHHGKLIGMEALLRWQHPERGLLMPSYFMKAFDETNFIVTIGRWVLSEACKQNKAWQDAGHAPLVVAVNISGQEMRHADFVRSVRQALDESGLDAKWLELEIKEDDIEADEELALSRLTEVSALGVRIALDNLGHSHIPLSFLTRFPIHAVKIDRSIVTDVATDANHAAVAKAVIAVARVLNIKGMAEGVETQEQLNFFRTEHCEDAQGYMFGKPLPSSACTELMGKLKLSGAKAFQA